nr:hypothetical protein Iba_chr14aCG5300 [Ipomoea batatas]
MERSAGRTGSKLAIALLLPLLKMSRRWGGLTLPLESLAGRPPAELIVVAAGYRSKLHWTEQCLSFPPSPTSDVGRQTTQPDDVNEDSSGDGEPRPTYIEQQQWGLRRQRWRVPVIVASLEDGDDITPFIPSPLSVFLDEAAAELFDGIDLPVPLLRSWRSSGGCNGHPFSARYQRLGVVAWRTCGEEGRCSLLRLASKLHWTEQCLSFPPSPTSDVGRQTTQPDDVNEDSSGDGQPRPAYIEQQQWGLRRQRWRVPVIVASLEDGDDITPFIPSPLSVFLDVSHAAAVAEPCG